MYIHLGGDALINGGELIGIFDLDGTTVSGRTRSFLAKAEKNGEIFTLTSELPKSFVLCSEKKREQKIFLSQLSSATLLKRSEFTDSF